MKIFQGSNAAQNKIKKPVIALGNFDGVHIAHQKLFEETRKLAKQIRGNSCVYTFIPHPVKVLSPLSAPPLINTLKQKIKLIEKNKIKALILEPFIKDFSHLNPEDFFQKILIQKLNAAGIVAGYDFTFGSKRSGKTELLLKLCQAHQIPCKILEAQYFKNTLISSSQIRQFIQQGHVEQAKHLLGRNFEILGQVVKGEGIGTSLGFPTANIMAENELIPGNGVYATRVKVGLRTYSSVSNIGFRPTFGGKKLTLETHLFKFKKRIYGKELRIQFIKKIRDEIAFSSIQDLIIQIKKDVETAKKIHKQS